jgi:hypothetical protein
MGTRMPSPVVTVNRMLCLAFLCSAAACSDDDGPSGDAVSIGPDAPVAMDLGRRDRGLDRSRDTSGDATADAESDAATDADADAGGDAESPADGADGSGGGCAIQVEVVETQGDVGWHTSVAADSTGALHVAYYHAGAGQLRYATNKGGIWTSQLVDGTGDVGRYASLHLDAADKAIVAYYDATQKRPKLAIQLAGGGWSTSTFDTAKTGVGTHLAGARDAAGALHLVYYDAVATDLRYAWLQGGSWDFAYVEQSQSDVGTHASIAVDGAGVRHVAYRDATQKDLRYAKSTGTKSFSAKTIDSQGDVGTDTAIAVTKAGEAHVVYHDKTTGAVKHAVLEGSGGVKTDTIAAGGLGWYGDVMIDGSGAGGNTVVHAAYYDYQNGALWYASNGGGGWKTVKVDGKKIAQVGWDLSMTLVAGSVHLTYYDAINTNLKHAMLTGCP